MEDRGREDMAALRDELGEGEGEEGREFDRATMDERRWYAGVDGEKGRSLSTGNTGIEPCDEEGGVSVKNVCEGERRPIVEGIWREVAMEDSEAYPAEDSTLTYCVMERGGGDRARSLARRRPDVFDEDRLRRTRGDSRSCNGEPRPVGAL